MYKLKIVTIKEFQESRDVWNRLALLMNLPSIFCTWEWIYTWWEHFGMDYEPVILFIYKDTELVGILPLAYHKTSNGILTGRRLSYCGSIELYPDHLDIICAKEDAEKCLDSVFEFLKSEFKDWDVLDISLLSEGSNFLSYLNKKDFYFITNARQASVAPYITLSSSFEEYSKNLGKNQKHDIRSNQRKLYEKFGFEYTSLDASQNAQALRTLFDLHELRIRSKKIVSTFNGKYFFNFHNNLIQQISKNNWLWFRFLKNKEKIISALYGFDIGGHLFYYQNGHDSEYEHYSTGKVLIYESIKEAFSKSKKEVDFLRGNEEYKNRWTKEHRALYAAAIYNKTIRANILKMTFQSKNLLKRALKKTIS